MNQINNLSSLAGVTVPASFHSTYWRSGGGSSSELSHSESKDNVDDVNHLGGGGGGGSKRRTKKLVVHGFCWDDFIGIVLDDVNHPGGGVYCTLTQCG